MRTVNYFVEQVETENETLYEDSSARVSCVRRTIRAVSHGVLRYRSETLSKKF